MSIIRIQYPNPLPTEQNDYVKQNELIETGFLKINNPNQFASGNVLKGTVIQLGGTVYLATDDTAIGGAQSEYVKFSKNGDGSEVSAAYVANLSGVSWNDAYNGYYDGDGNLYLFNEQVLFRKGDHSIQLTHYDDTTVPAIAAGGAIEINGGLYTNLTEITISGSTANSTWYDILLIPSGKTFTASFVARNTGTWSDSKQGLYSGNNRVIGCIYVDGSGNYINKNVFQIINRTIKIKIEIGDWDMDADTAVLVLHGLGNNISKIRSVSGVIRSDSGTTMYSINYYESSTFDYFDCAIAYIDTLRLRAARRTGGAFDTASFDSTSYNRGWFFLEYEV